MRRSISFASLPLTTLFFSLNVFAGPRVVGNGGDSIRSGALLPQEVSALVPGARFPVIAWLQSRQRQFREASTFQHLGLKTSPAERRLFAEDGKPLFDMIRRMRIQVHESAPCPSSAGHRDGSVIGEEAICLSAALLGEKLTRENAARQIEGLILHEISHLLGAPEEEAVALQTDYLLDMIAFPRERIFQLAEDRARTLQSLSWVLQYLSEYPQSASSDQFKNAIKSSRQLVLREQPGLSGFSFSLFPESSSLIWQWVRVVWAQVRPKLPVGTHEIFDHYEEGFAGDLGVSLYDLKKRIGYPYGQDYEKTLQLRRIRTPDDLTAELLRIRKAVEESRRDTLREKNAVFIRFFDDVLSEGSER